MRKQLAIAAGIAASALLTTGANAGCGCDYYGYGGYGQSYYGYGGGVSYAEPTYSYAQPNYVVQPNIVVQPTYVSRPTYLQRHTILLDGGRAPTYDVNQGPVYDGPNYTAFPRPVYSEGSYAYAQPYPYVGGAGYGRGYGSLYERRYATPYAGRYLPRYRAGIVGPRVYRAGLGPYRVGGRIVTGMPHRYAARRFGAMAVHRPGMPRYRVPGHWR